MAERPLNPDEAALWARVIDTVRPAPGKRAPTLAAATTAAPAAPRSPGPPPPVLPAPAARKPTPQTLDGSWDRSLARGTVAPDRIVDLHGHTLSSAYARIDAALAAAIAAGERVLLLVTGKPGGERPGTGRLGTGRGAIRAVVGDWLAASRHAGRIAAVRNAHPRHGGAGALYLVLRRR